MSEENNKEKLRTLKGARLYGFSAGVLGQILPVTLISAYIFIFFTYAIGLNALLVSIGTALGVVVLAFFAPIFGYLVDKKRPGRLGKRRPFLILSLPLIIFSLIIMWYSPLAQRFGEINWVISFFLWAFLLIFYLAYALLRSTYLSMIPEQSQIEENRIKIGSLTGIFSILATVIGIFLPLIIQSRLITPDAIFYNPIDRQFLIGALPILGWVFAMFVVIFTLLAYFSTNEDFYSEIDEKTTLNEDLKIKKVLKNIFRPFSDKNYYFFLFSMLIATIGIRLLVKNLTLFFTFVLNLKGNAFVLFILPLVTFAVLGFIFWSRRAHSVGIKKSFIQARWFTAISLILTGILLIGMPNDILLWIARILFAGVLFGLVVGYILPNPAISELVDNSPKEIMEKMDSNSLSGSYFGTFLFVLNIGHALGDLILGVILMGPNAKNSLAIGIVFPIAGVLYFMSNLILNKIDLR
ncbi:MAG: MFS transporter [Candidatus Helarchaeota archaeon]|nr:MFS transporter [Candidatus Helarchaeota archaeon]